MTVSRAFALDSRGHRRLGPGRVVVELPDGWTAPGLFGGMAMACAVRAAEALSDPGAETMRLLSASAMFHRPMTPGPAEIEVTELARTRRTWSRLARLDDRMTVSFTCTPASELGRPGPAPASGPAPEVPGPEQLRPILRGPGGASGAGALARQVDWRAVTPWWARRESGPILSWLRPRRTPWTADGYLDPLWYLVAADLLGPCLFDGRPRRVATLSLDVQVLGVTRSPWLLQRVTPDADGPWSAGRIELWDRAGRLVATGSQRARLTPAAAEELPWSVTAFGWGKCRETEALDCSLAGRNSCMT